MREKILLVGAGYMAREYAQVLMVLKMPFIVIGRGKKSAQEFEKEIGHKVITGGIDNWFKKEKKYPLKAIVAVNENQLAKITKTLIKYGFKSILVEKPGGLNNQEIKSVDRAAKLKKAKVYIAYNRRFYASVKRAQEIIKKDGGVQSFNFEFTEWVHKIPAKLKKSPAGKEWFLVNSTHIIDMAFFLGGKPKKINGYTARGLKWHPRASIYAGSGITKKGALFSYIANWESAGRWWIEINTPKHKLIFRPLEKLHIQNIGSVAIEEVKIDDKLDINFKPGLYKQVQSFLGNKKRLMTIQNQTEALKYYDEINKQSTSSK